MTVLNDWKRCLCVCRPPILGHNRRLYCHGNWLDGGQTQLASPQEYTPETRLHPANSTAKKRQVVGAAPELVSEAGEPILCRFWEHTASPLRRLPKPLLEARSRFWPVTREPCSLILKTAPGAVFGSLEPLLELLPTTI